MTELEPSGRRVQVKTRRVIGADQPDGQAQQPFLKFLTTIWQRRLIVIVCVAVALTVGIVYLVNAVKLYSSASSVYVQRSMPKIVEDQISNNGQSVGYLFTQCQVATSTAILNGALQQPGVSDLKALQNVGNPVGFLKSVVAAVPDRQGDIINVAATTEFPQDSAVIVNAVVQSYIEYLGSQHKSTSVEVLRLLQKEVDRREKDLQASRDAMLALRRDNPTLVFDSVKESVATSQLSEKLSALSAANTRLMDLKTAEQEIISLKDPNAVLLVLQQYQVPFAAAGDSGQISAEYSQTMRELRMLKNTLGPEHRAVQAEQHQLDDLQGELAGMNDRTIADYKTAVASAIVAAEAKVKQISDQIGTAQLTAVDSNTKQAQYAALAQDMDRSERSLDLLDSRMKEVGIGEDAGAMSVSVLETGKPNFFPVSPKQSKVIGLSLIAGLLAGIGLAILLDATDHKLYTTDEMMAAMELPMLGMIPRMLGRVSATDRAQEVHLRPRSLITEAYRSLRTSLAFSSMESGGAKTLLITSPTMTEGKSTVTSNVAVAFAHANRKVLLIDADCRRPSVAKLFKLKDGPGLSNVLMKQALAKDVIQSTSIDNLDILPSGPLPTNPAELLDSAAFVEMLNSVSGMYNLILIDSPPVMPVTDARIIAASVDSTVLVIRSGRSTRRLATQSRDILRSMGANVIGVIANDISRGLDAYQYTGYRLKDSKKNGRGAQRPERKTAEPIVARSIPAGRFSDEDHDETNDD